jgi:hypothetical protein
LQAQPIYLDFDDHGGDPDPEMRQLSQEFGWEYVTSAEIFMSFVAKTGKFES